jgi:hypothetical protein
MTADTLFPVDPPPQALTIDASDSATVKLTKRRAALIAQGLHPMGGGLRSEPGETCGSCHHAVKTGNRQAKFIKCELTRQNWTKGPGTDIRLKWPACSRWEPRAGDAP